jgi:serine/threonine protein kinase
MAPEEALGKPVDPRADLFSLGVLLCELLTGHRPLPAGNSDSARPAPSIISRLLAEQPDARYHSVG